MKKLVVLTGAGISAESGIKTFRGSGGLWEGYDVMEVASPEGWQKNPELVLDFYNQRRRNVLDSQPNGAHYDLANLETRYNVQIITQNIDDLHERAGSKNIIHLHGEILKSRSTVDEKMVFEMTSDRIEVGDLCPQGSQLRPHIVWFGESVPLIEKAALHVAEADLLLVVGTSMEVYPAAGLSQMAPQNCPVFLIDPNPSHTAGSLFTQIVDVASSGLKTWIKDYEI